MKNKTKDKPDTIVIKKLKTENRQSDKAQTNKNAVFFRKHIAAFILVISALCLSGVLLAFLHFNNKSTPASADAIQRHRQKSCQKPHPKQPEPIMMKPLQHPLTKTIL